MIPVQVLGTIHTGVSLPATFKFRLHGEPLRLLMVMPLSSLSHPPLEIHETPLSTLSSTCAEFREGGESLLEAVKKSGIL